MSPNIESELRAAFGQRAADVREDSVARVRNHDYTMLRRRRRVQVAVGASGAGALAVGLGVAITIFVSSAPAAYANWSPTPTSASASQIEDAEAACITALDNGIAQADSNQEPPTFIADMSAWHSVIEDVQGPYVLVGYSASEDGASNAATCLTPTTTIWSGGPEIFVSNVSSDAAGYASGESVGFGGPFQSGSAVNTAVKGGVGVGASSAPPNPDTIANPSIDAARPEVTFVIGDAGAGVSALTLDLSGGTSVDATVQNGYYAAWWPSDSTITSAQLTSPTGVTTVTLPDVPQPTGNGSPSGDSNSVVRTTGD
jgi:hypothetical protein